MVDYLAAVQFADDGGDCEGVLGGGVGRLVKIGALGVSAGGRRGEMLGYQDGMAQALVVMQEMEGLRLL